MTDHRAIEGITLSYGYPGRASYDTEEKKWMFASNQNDEHHIRQLQHFKEHIPASLLEVPVDGETPSTASKNQLKYLVKTIPEVFPGNEIIASLAKPEPISQPEVGMGSLLAWGRAYENKHLSTILATPCGDAGHVLRLVKCRKDKRSWESGRGAAYLTLMNPELWEQGFWAGSGGSIRQVLFAEGDRDSNTWLAVRQATVSTIFRPCFGHVQPTFAPSGLGRSYPPSRLNANPVAALTAEKSILKDHVDVSFNPWYTRQFALIDSKGKWCICEIEGPPARHSPQKISLGKRGCISDGYQPPPNQRLLEPNSDGWHRIFWACDINTIVVCSRWHITIFDTKTKPRRLRSIEFSPTSPDQILDVKRSSTSDHEIFVLTGSRIFWIEITAAGEGEGEEVYAGSKVLLSYYHFRSATSENLQLVVLDDPNISVLITSNTSTLINIFGFKHSGAQKIPVSWQGSFLLERKDRHRGATPLLSILFVAAPLTPSAGVSLEKGVRYLQVWALLDDLSISSSVCILHHQSLGASHLSKRWLSVPGVQQKLSYRHARLGNRASDSFITPDSLGKELYNQSAVARSRYHRIAIMGGGNNDPRLRVDWRLMFKHVFNYTGVNDQADQSRIGLADSISTFSSILSNYTSRLKEGKENNYLPLSSLLELSEQKSFLGEFDVATTALSEYLHSLQQEQNLDDSSQLVVSDLVEVPGMKFNIIETSNKPDFLRFYDGLVETWMALPQQTPIKTRLFKYSMIRQIAIQLSLSSVGIFLREKLAEDDVILRSESSRDTESLAYGHSVSERHSLPQDYSPEMTPESSQSLHLGLPTPSQTPSIYSRATTSDPGQIEDPTTVRLRQYALSIKSRLNPGQSRILSRWTPGGDPSEYKWKEQGPSLEESGDESGRKKRREDTRRHKRAEIFLNLEREKPDTTKSRPAYAPTGSQPAVSGHVSSSQPVVEIPMTQPVGGMFGSRSAQVSKSLRKPKRRHAGF
ncbi:RNA polymerase I-specific transcription initiation factor RRN6-like protein [Tricladium varicosporioides]|nr:RNA polymerase I-specific transcription initiation factor RRN6-like protein [Hymenoscyphus varicosporioides]